MARKTNPAADPCPSCDTPMMPLVTTISWCAYCGTLTGVAKAVPMHSPMRPAVAEVMLPLAAELTRKRAAAKGGR